MEDDEAAAYTQIQTSRSATEPPSGKGMDAVALDDPAKGDAKMDYRIVPLPQRLQEQPPESIEPFCTNVVITSKYTPWNFLPLFMIESFRKVR